LEQFFQNAFQDQTDQTGLPPMMSRQAGARVCRNSLFPGWLRLLRLVPTGMIVGGAKLALLVVAGERRRPA
jgi:hypothetical protein